MTRNGRRLSAWIACVLTVVPPGAAADAPRADPSPSPPASAVDPEAFPLRRAAAAREHPVPAPPEDPCRLVAGPCFPAQVERQDLTPEQKLARFFEQFDARHGPTFASAPTVEELRRLPAARALPLDFLPLVRLLIDARRRHQPPRYFLYAARRGERAWPVLREGRLPAESAHALPGLTYEELGGFRDRKSAEAAYRRLDQLLAGAGRPVTP